MRVLVSAVLLGCLATRFEKTDLKWDTKGLKFTNTDKANAFVKRDDIQALATWDVTCSLQRELSFRTSRVLLQDFTGVPAVVDLEKALQRFFGLGEGSGGVQAPSIELIAAQQPPHLRAARAGRGCFRSSPRSARRFSATVRMPTPTRFRRSHRRLRSAARST